MVTSNNSSRRNNNKYYYENHLSNQCEHICCTGLTDGLLTLKINSKNSNNYAETILNLSSHTDSNVTIDTDTTSSKKSRSSVKSEKSSRHSRREKRRKRKKRKHSPEPPNLYDFCPHVADYNVKTPDTMSPNMNLDISFVSTIVENFDKESTDFILDLNPVRLEKDNNNLNNTSTHTAVTELEEFEFNNTLNDTLKASAIPPDLHNLNLRKFSPSPVINCLSPNSNSPGHTYLQDHDNCTFSEKNEESNIDLKSQAFTGNFKSDVDCSSNMCNYKLEKVWESVNFVTNSNEPVIEKVIVDSHLPENKLNVNFETDKPTELMEEESTVTTSSIRGVDTNLTSPENEETETRLPLKKRKLSVANSKEDKQDGCDVMGPDLVEEIIRRARAEVADKEDISYPAKPMISIAELAEQSPRIFKTPAEKKEMPPPRLPKQPAACNTSLNLPPKIVTEQYNNLTYNNPTINYHMNNIPYSFLPCASLPYFPSFLVPVNSTTTIDMNMVPKQEQHQQLQPQPPENQEPPITTAFSAKPKKEKKPRGRKRHH